MPKNKNSVFVMLSDHITSAMPVDTECVAQGKTYPYQGDFVESSKIQHIVRHDTQPRPQAVLGIT